MWFFLNLYLQQVLGYGALEGGAALLPMTVTIMVLMVVVAPKVMARVGFKPMIVGGLLVLAAGLLGLSLARSDGNFAVARLLPNGTLDPDFTDTGVMTIDFFGFTDLAESVAVTDDGGILVSGLARDNVDGYGVARLSPQS